MFRVSLGWRHVLFSSAHSALPCSSLSTRIQNMNEHLPSRWLYNLQAKIGGHALYMMALNTHLYKLNVISATTMRLTLAPLGITLQLSTKVSLPMDC